MGTRHHTTGDLIVGAAIAGIVVALLYIGGAAVYRQIVRAPSTTATLSAHITPGNTVQVIGHVHQGGKAVEGGKVKVTVRERHGLYEQSAMVDIAHGRFELSNAAQLRPRDPAAPMEVAAKIWPAGSAALTERVYLHRRSPETSTNVLIALTAATLVFLAIFFIAFTGRPSPRKNRVAIVLSYCVILLFLALPLVAPPLIQRLFPDLQQAMNRSAVGIVITRPRTEIEGQGDTQWALNIGGYATPARVSESDVPSRLVDVEGGLVIPLFVIILSVIGGAINMTRQVPKFQREGETLETTEVTDVAKGVLARRSTVADWRAGLLNQYMYLIAAPFLAIAVFYFLTSIGLTKVPVLVLVSFSIGLLSEAIVSALLQKVSGYLSTKPARREPAAQAERHEVPVRTEAARNVPRIPPSADVARPDAGPAIQPPRIAPEATAAPDITFTRPTPNEIFTITSAPEWPDIHFETNGQGAHSWRWTLSWGRFQKSGTEITADNKWSAKSAIVNCGGTLSVCAEAGQAKTTINVKIEGTNPDVADILQYLTATPHSAGFDRIIRKESKFKHFNGRNEPLKSFDNGYGLCQLTNPAPTFEQVWNWQLNIDRGLTVFDEKRISAIAYLGQHNRTYTADQLKCETVCRWNGGRYHQWDQRIGKWVRSPNILCDSQTGNIGWDMNDPVLSHNCVVAYYAAER